MSRELTAHKPLVESRPYVDFRQYRIYKEDFDDRIAIQGNVQTGDGETTPDDGTNGQPDNQTAIERLAMCASCGREACGSFCDNYPIMFGHLVRC